MRDKEIIGLWEAYQQVYAQEVVEEIEELDEEPKGLPYGPVGKGFKKIPAGPKRNKMMKREKDYTKKAMDYASREGEAAGGDRQKMGRIGSALSNPRLREGTDLFDTILEYLVAEGYADTNENALVIMANMSEEWRESIVEESMPPRRSKEERSKRAKELGNRQTIRNVVGKYNKEKSSSKQENPDKYYPNN